MTNQINSNTLIKKIEQIKNEFITKADKLKFEFDKKIQTILDEDEAKQIRKTINK